MEEFHYRIPWRSRNVHPGHHRSQIQGVGLEFRGHATLIDYPDPRKLDIHASLHDPFGQHKVKLFSQTSLIPILVVADLSASMGFGTKPKLLSRLAAAIAYSAYRTGDLFGFLGVNDRIVLQYPLRFSKCLALELKHRLEKGPFQGKHLGMLRVGPYLGRQRALLFLISDFHFALTEVEALLTRLKPHDVVPVALWMSQEWQAPARWGWAKLYDPETGHRRFLWLSPSSQAKLACAFCNRREQLIALCRRYGRPPFFIEDEFYPEKLTQYFWETCA